MPFAPPPLSRDRIDDHWSFAQEFWTWICAIFGKPEALAQNAVIAADAAMQLRAWLRNGEIMVRRILICAAALLPPPRTAPDEAKRAYAIGAEQNNSVPEIAHPTARGAHFALCMRQQRSAPRRARNAPSRERAPFLDARPLVRRMEALARVLANPAPYAQRMARLIQRKPKRAIPIITWKDVQSDRLDASQMSEFWIDACCALDSLTPNSS